MMDKEFLDFLFNFSIHSQVNVCKAEKSFNNLHCLSLWFKAILTILIDSVKSKKETNKWLSGQSEMLNSRKCF